MNSIERQEDGRVGKDIIYSDIDGGGLVSHGLGLKSISKSKERRGEEIPQWWWCWWWW